MAGEPVDADELRREESVPLRGDVTLAMARSIGARTQELGEQRSLPIAIAVRLGGRTVFQVALDGSTPLNDAWLMKKIHVTETFHQSTLLVRAEHEASGKDFHGSHGGSPQYWAPAGGAVCLRDSTLTFRGVLAVSGLTQIEDHALCREALASFV